MKIRPTSAEKLPRTLRMPVGRPLFSFFAAVLLASLHGGLASEPFASGVVTITKDGILRPVPLVDGKLPKNSPETFYLESALEPKPRRASADSPSAGKKKERPAAPSARREAAKPAPPSKVSKKNPVPAKTARELPTVTIRRKSADKKAPDKQRAVRNAGPDDDLEEYNKAGRIADPLEPANRCVFWVNHQIYSYVFRPLSKIYTTVLPRPVRSAVFNVCDNVEFPVRFVNHLLQLKFDRAGLETRKFLVNSVGGVGGLIRMSDRTPALADLPPADTGQTLSKWGIGHGPYIVLPVLGPKSLRDTVGLAGDYALNPVTWVSFGGIGGATALAITSPPAINSMSTRLDAYDAASKNSIDRYIALRSAYVQSRENAVSK